MRLRTLFRLTIAATLFATAGCAATDLSTRLNVVASADGLTLVNETERPVFYIAYEKGIEPLLDWYPCTDAARCNPLHPGERRIVAWSAILGDRPSPASYVVTWWQSELSPDGTPHPTNTHSVLIPK